MLGVASASPSELAVRLLTGEKCSQMLEGRFRKVVIGEIGYSRDVSRDRFRGLARRIPTKSAEAIYSICSSSKMQGPESHGFGMIRGTGAKNSGALRKENAMQGEGEKSITEPTSENAMLDQSYHPGKASLPASSAPKATNIVWQECSVTKEERQKLLGQKGCVIWITGLSGSGKSTLACMLSRALHSKGKLAYVLDGDNVRHGLNKNLGFSAEDRAENIRRVGEVAKLFADAGIICIASLISPYQRDRAACRSLLPAGDFIEVFMNIPLEICEERDAKGLYKLARAGKIKGFTGIDDPYEPPVNCEIIVQPINGTCPTPKATEVQVISYLEEQGFI